MHITEAVCHPHSPIDKNAPYAPKRPRSRENIDTRITLNARRPKSVSTRVLAAL